MRLSVFLIVGLEVGCVHTVDAPVELTTLSPKMFADQDDADLLSEDLDGLASWLDSRESVEDGYILPPMPESGVVDITRPPNTSLGNTIGGLADAQSTATLQQQVDFILLADQTVVNPDDYSTFDRTFLEGEDCFGDGSCDRLVTENDMVKTADFGVTIPYFYFKDYQRVTFVDADGTERNAVVSRGWIEEEGWEEVDPEKADQEPKNGLVQSYTLDVFMETADGTVHRTQSLWTEMVLSIDGLVSEQFLEDQLILGLQGVFEDTDAAIAELGL